jgi:hypothetical protein
VNVDDRILVHLLELHRPVMEDGESYCQLDDECYPCKDVMLATIAMRLGRLVELLERGV